MVRCHCHMGWWLGLPTAHDTAQLGEVSVQAEKKAKFRIPCLRADRVYTGHQEVLVCWAERFHAETQRCNLDLTWYSL